ncbi:MAG: hypothetical protein A3C30_02595 [Candidatus Levybacteria bacterium RIFCSPHIGHO2_02_FULL_40_18]|nr:MAG: hypothetical protein A2869_05380 [Candidatus Levybacteria bacterium RIFCSPHIGHO2_01_FULL_40_58]OGH26864.1 MAG: hypothetical protein A3C30_02595 [Candidatus Levybacteria bacterium RIFCSPHIGHO2_02_FULL_40_18]OGH31986.1 MAG: hypothetical protein A3E43_03575 [Candidatus Levybacteria bacterium RIFCSPHIGHO2_12_FULL_40_31]OGH40892.1 MAG: hypothetical protein A2894_04825 [Candidatus Levybacteria bacterium RIFCSPLOWO2_01_FULL_40_64]OGH49537.1 MAG: hypothetical protein A3I54_00120 [Candidatus Lev
MKRILISGILIGLFITLGSIAAILYATGYRISLNGGSDGKIIAGTGLLVATSRPDGARLLINNNLTTATNNTINLKPGEYDARIEKDGYLPWSKKIIIKNGLVSEANAFLFPVAPKLEAVTTIGVLNVTMDRSGSILAYAVASASASRNGIYVLDMNARNLIFLAATGTQIVGDIQDKFSQAQELSFSPDGRELLVKLTNSVYYLLATDSRNQNPSDVTNTLLAVQRDWEQQRTELDKKIMDSMSRDLRNVALTHFKNIIPSPEGDKLLYEASVSAKLPIVLRKPVPSVNSTPDERNLVAGRTYIYDVREDKNYFILDPDQIGADNRNKYLWHPDGRHLIFARSGKINIVEYDGGNLTTVYNGPFLDNLVFPWPDGSSITIVTRLSESAPHNIYRISLQ